MASVHIIVSTYVIFGKRINKYAEYTICVMLSVTSTNYCRKCPLRMDCHGHAIDLDNMKGCPFIEISRQEPLSTHDKNVLYNTIKNKKRRSFFLR
jgi:hypothetical protein